MNMVVVNMEEKHNINESHEGLFWQACIRITQAPESFQPQLIPETAVPFYQKHEDIRSFLYDPFGNNPPDVYGLELTANDNIKPVFFTKVISRREALKLGHAWLSNLRFKFIGLDGKVKAKRIRKKNQEVLKKSQLFEIILPMGYIKNKINIIERFISAFYHKTDQPTQLIIFWQREPRSEKSQEQSNLFNIRGFIKCDLSNSSEDDKLKFEGIIQFLAMDIENQIGDRARVVNPSNVSNLNLLEGSVFNDSYESLRTFAQEDVNFDFPENLPLPRLPILKNENVRYIDIHEEFKKRAITVGHHIKDGVITNHETFVPINKLPQDLAIFGKSGSGKTYFLARFIQELAKKSEKVGILILNIAKESQEIFYHNFIKLKYSDMSFHIPYFIKDKKVTLKKRLQETATYICASLGLKNVFEKIIYRTEIGFLELKCQLPEFFIGLLRGVEIYIKNNPYGPEEQANLLQVFRNRMNVFDEDKVQNVLKITDSLPKWILDWLNGENIFLDLSTCSKFVKMLIVNAIFQLVRTVTRDSEAEELKHLIVIDEAHAILEKPITNNSDDADFIMKEQMAKIFSELLKEYRSRGVGFVIADQSPDNLFKDVTSQPSIRIIFREDFPNITLFSEDSFDRQMLTQLENRLALVINGATGEKYLIKTLNFFP
ncbi:MAG: ATP-binding protein [Candidatus Odinarchaeota archaeon]